MEAEEVRAADQVDREAARTQVLVLAADPDTGKVVVRVGEKVGSKRWSRWQRKSKTRRSRPT